MVKKSVLCMFLVACQDSETSFRSLDDYTTGTPCSLATIHYVATCEYLGDEFADCEYPLKVVSDDEFEAGDLVTVVYATCNDDGRAVQMAISPRVQYDGRDFF